MRSWRGASAVTVAVAAALSSASLAGATFADAATGSSTYATGVLAPATNPSASGGACSTATGDRIVLTWTATPTHWATGYEIARASTPGGPYVVVGNVSGRTTTTYTSGPLPFATTYHYAIRAVRNSWRSTDASVSRQTRGPFCI